MAIYVLSLTSITFAQKHTQHISFDDTLGPGNAGIYNSTDSFGVDLYLTYEGYDSYGLSLWFETTANAASNIFLTGFTYGTTFTDPNQPFASFPMGFTQLQFDGIHYTTPDPSDLGATVAAPPLKHPVGPGTYFVGHLSVSLSGLLPGTYVLQSAAGLPHRSIVSSYDGTNFIDELLPAATYTITVVPEPSTFALLLLTAIGGGACICRRTVSNVSPN